MQLFVIAVTAFSTLQWWDKGSGGSSDGSYWAPNIPFGYYAAGSMGTSGYSANPIAGNTFYALRPGLDAAALNYPLRYERIWGDYGSGADLDGSMWRPVCSSGYVALGTVAQRGYDQPRRESVVCVKRQYTVRGKIGQYVWNDRSTGSDTDFGSWLIADAPDSQPGLAIGTFYGTTSHNPPTNSNELYVLDLNAVTFA